MIGPNDVRPGQPRGQAGYRLCVVTDSTEIGGAERFLANLVAALPEDVDVVAVGPDRAVLEHVVSSRQGARAETVDRSVRGFRRGLAHVAPDVVHLNLTAFTSCRAAAVACLLQRTRMVLVDHLPTPGLTWRGRAVQRGLTRASVVRIAVGSAAARDVERFGGLRPGSVLAIPNGVPDPDCTPSPLRNGPLVVGALARLEEQKGLDILLRALRSLPEVTALIAGEGSRRHELERLADEAGLAGRVQFLGPVSSPCVLLTRIDALTVPSRWEGMPLAILEAMHCGVPVVATDVGSVREAVVDGETGIIVPPEDAEALAGALRALALDPGLRRRLAVAARARAGNEFSVARMAARYDAQYRRVLGVLPAPNSAGGPGTLGTAESGD